MPLQSATLKEVSICRYRLNSDSKTNRIRTTYLPTHNNRANSIEMEVKNNANELLRCCACSLFSSSSCCGIFIFYSRLLEFSPALSHINGLICIQVCLCTYNVHKRNVRIVIGVILLYLGGSGSDLNWMLKVMTPKLECGVVQMFRKYIWIGFCLENLVIRKILLLYTDYCPLHHCYSVLLIYSNYIPAYCDHLVISNIF